MGIEQRRRGHFGGKAIQGHGLQVVVRLDAGQQGGQRHGAVAHVPFVGNVVADVEGLHLRMLEQFLRLPGATVRAQIQIQLCGQKGRAEQQGPEQNKHFQSDRRPCRGSAMKVGTATLAREAGQSHFDSGNSKTVTPYLSDATSR
ncbi:hypothetical protein D9M71_622060 [compost metagenome]